MCMCVQKFHISSNVYVCTNISCHPPSCHKLHVSLLIEKCIVQTKNALSKSGNVCCYALFADKPLKLQWLLYIPPTITLDTEICPCNVFVFFI